MQSNAERSQKSQATTYLDQWQKTPEAWQQCFAILQDASMPNEVKMFATTTMKGKVVYDLHQLPRASLPSLRDSLLSACKSYAQGPKPVRMQLCVCLAQLSIQMIEWDDVLPMIMSTFHTDATGLPCIFDFLKVLPEEVTDGKKINLTENQLIDRTQQLLGDNAPQVLQLLTQYAASSANASQDPQLIECIQSWTREVPIADLVASPLFQVVLHALEATESFEPAIDCLCTMIRETRDVDETLDTINRILPEVVKLRPKLVTAAEEEDNEMFNGISRLLTEAGEAWTLLMARSPADFSQLTQGILQICALDKEKEVIGHTFGFWYELKQYLTLDKYMQARLQYVEVYSRLMDILMKQLEFPKPESGNEVDVFEGDREAEDNFKEFRHQMGSTIKDCCEVLGITECLRKPYDLIQTWMQSHAQKVSGSTVPEWQSLEAPIFAMRMMGRMVPPEENIMVPQLMPLILQIPSHEKLRFQAVMTVGRYTEWTAEHPQTLKPQLDFIIESFNYPSVEVVRAAALSFRFFCEECGELLKEQAAQLQAFYVQTLDNLPKDSQEELTEGVAAVIAKQPPDRVYGLLSACCNPIIQGIMTSAQSNPGDKETQMLVADKVKLITSFIQWVQPEVAPGQQNPAVKYCQEIFPVLSTLVDGMSTSLPVVEEVCKLWRYMVLSYRSAIAPLLPQLANKLASGFSATRQGSYLWASNAILREFSADVGHQDASISDAVYQFYDQQATTFLRTLSDLPPDQLPDVIEDFFRFAEDALMGYSVRAIPSPLMAHIVSASTTCLTILKTEPLRETLRFLRDLISYGLDTAPTSSYDQSAPVRNPPEVQAAVKQLFDRYGEEIVQRVLTGMMQSFSEECFLDASAVLVDMFKLMPVSTAGWVKGTIAMVPEGSISQQERERLMVNIEQRVQTNQIPKIRAMLQDFTTSYRRRNVQPREGLREGTGKRFRFPG